MSVFDDDLHHLDKEGFVGKAPKEAVPVYDPVYYGPCVTCGKVHGGWEACTDIEALLDRYGIACADSGIFYAEHPTRIRIEALVNPPVSDSPTDPQKQDDARMEVIVGVVSRMRKAGYNEALLGRFLDEGRALLAEPTDRETAE